MWVEVQSVGSHRRLISLHHCRPPQDDPICLSVKFTKMVHDKDINSVSVSPNDKLVVTGSQDRTAKVRTCSKECVHVCFWVALCLMP